MTWQSQQSEIPCSETGNKAAPKLSCSICPSLRTIGNWTQSTAGSGGSMSRNPHRSPRSSSSTSFGVSGVSGRRGEARCSRLRVWLTSRPSMWLNALLLVLVLFTVAHSAQWAEAVYRVEVAPVVAILAGGVVAWWRSRLSKVRQSLQLRRARRMEHAKG